ncbi:hypothetical protein ZEAMMB73_Zm00001d005375 [Zea mays]|uniref:Cathepsin propeptide inhibitor domain-containing protein n=1 Tax=Zea mays TaxID=4577 RepID=A0A1D6EM70_MAIZE|nr:hypothetical protein ZEAMMB73_Zm00001d005375 [Zea mays]
MASSSKRSLPCVLLLLLLAVFHHGCSSARAHRRAGDMEGSMSTDDSSMIERFQRWKAAYNKSYATVAEERRRFRVYARNMAYIEATNAEAEAAGLTYELGETAYTDLTNQEFMAMYTAPAPAQLPADESVITTRAGPVDAVGGAPGQLPVCCSCLSHMHACLSLRKTHMLLSWMDGFTRSEASLANAVAGQPVAVSIEAGGDNFQHYKKGVYNGPCGTNLKHGVTVVGYGQEAAGGDRY